MSFNLICETPEILTPEGGDTVVSSRLLITWKGPSSVLSDTDRLGLVYELFFTSEYDSSDNFSWKQIAVVQYGETGYLWKIPKISESNKCRIAIRLRNIEGKRTPLGICKNDFNIAIKKPSAPNLISPVDGGKYFSYVPIRIDYSNIANTYSESGIYEFYYSSSERNIPWTLIATNVAYNSPPIYWDVSLLPPADDYVIRSELSLGSSKSLPVFVKDIQIGISHMCIVDTTPPGGSVFVVDNEDFTKDRDVVLRLASFDETTEVKDVQIKQINDGDFETPISGPTQSSSDIITWSIQGGDGQKTILAVFTDVAGNKLSDDSELFFFRPFNSKDNIEVGSFTINKRNVVDSQTNTITSQWDIWQSYGTSIYQNKSLFLTTSEIVTAMIFYDGILHYAVIDEENTSKIYKYTDTSVLLVSFSDQEDSFVSSMVVYDNKLFIGMQNGNLYSFSGGALVLEETFDGTIKMLSTDNINLYIGVDNSDVVNIIYRNGSNYSTTEVSMGDVSI